MPRTTDVRLDNAIRCLEDARRELRGLYLGDPADDVAAASTPVPAQYSGLSDALRVAQEHLLNLRDC
jgi:hypothetical protein